MTRFREIESKYDSRCSKCGRALSKGDGVWWKKGERARCGDLDCTPYEERALYGDLATRARHGEMEKADARRFRCLELFPFLRIDRTGAAEPLLEDLRNAREPKDVHAIIDEIAAVTEPVPAAERSGLSI